MKKWLGLIFIRKGGIDEIYLHFCIRDSAPIIVCYKSKPMKKTYLRTKLIIPITFFFFILFSNLNAQDPQQGWNFQYPGDKFTDDAKLDLRYLNENYAGENGFIQLSEDGNSFVNGNGEPVRFWSINGGDQTRDFSDNDLAFFARFLSKVGVNMIRYHGSINPPGKGTMINDVDTDEVKAIWRMVAAMKKEGIYSTISPFWPHNGHMGGWVPEEWGIDGYSGTDDLWEVMYFSDTLKNAYKNWVKYLYTETNPYTGIPLKDDPAVGLIQIENEDGVFWWTISSVHPELAKVIRQKFYQWLIDKYGTIASAKAAWYNASTGDDDPDNGEMGVYHIWDATQPQSGGKALRINEQIQFFIEVQRNFYTEIHDYYRELGCKQLINGNNWKTADPNLLFDAERYTNASCEVLAVNRYYDPGHVGPNAGWRIDPGDHYVGKSALFVPHLLPVNIKQVSGHPMIVTESAWNLPNKYQAEGPFLIASYMSLTGVDSYYWFSPTSKSYDSNPYFTWAWVNGTQHPLFRWTISSPGQMAMFPANALLFRKGYIKPGETVVHEERSLASIYARKMPLISEENSFDPNRDSYDQINPSKETAVSPLAHLTGKVEVVYDGNPDSSKVSGDLESLIDYQNKDIKSSNNELNWDYKTGISIMDAPSAQGVCGFVGEKQLFELSDVTIETTNNYAAINVVAMDDKPIAESSKILIQVGTVSRPTGWKETAESFDMSGTTVDGFRIDNTGKMPWKCANTQVKLTIKNSSVNKATILDVAGYAKTEIPLTKSDNDVEIELPENTLYVVLEKGSGTKAEIQKKNKMNVYPNPNHGSFAIELPGSVNSEYALEIRNLLGQKIWEMQNLHQGKIDVNLENHSGGLLVVALKENDAVVETTKISIKN